MKNRVLGIMIFMIGFIMYAQSPVGVWKTIDDETGKAKSHIQIYEKNGKLYGKILKLLIKPENDNCVKCTGALKNKPLIGLEILKDMKKEGSSWTGGKIMDPKKGSDYKCNMEMQGNNKLKVRGYVGFSLLGRTQVWERVE